MGGRRRSSANKPQPKKRPRLDKVFKCPKCFHDGSVFVNFDKKSRTATLDCKVCGEKHRYSKATTLLTEPIDVFHEWIDVLEEEKSNPRARRPDAEYDDVDEDGLAAVAPRRSLPAPSSSRGGAAPPPASAGGSRKPAPAMQDDDIFDDKYDLGSGAAAARGSAKAGGGAAASSSAASGAASSGASGAGAGGGGDEKRRKTVVDSEDEDDLDEDDDEEEDEEDEDDE